MLRVRIGVTVLSVALLGAAAYQDKDKDKEKKADDPPPGKMKGMLPPKFGKLGLSEDQKKKIYKIQSEYKGKIKDLQEKIAKAKQEQKEAEEGVLTKEQKKKLRELQTGEKGSDK